MNKSIKADNKQDINLIKYLGFPLVILGLILAFRGASFISVYFKSASWPTVKASIVSSRLVRTGGRHATTGIIGTFTYEFNGKAYSSNNIDIVGGKNGDPAEKERKQAILESAKNAAKTLEARVNPDNPEYAFIFRELNIDAPGYLLMGAGMIWIGLLLIKPCMKKS
jgi:hypothetical protein